MLNKYKQKTGYIISGLVLLLSFSAAGQAVAATKSSSTTSSKKTNTGSASSATATAPTTTLSNGVSQSYDAAPSIKTGMIVELAPKSTTSVIPITQKDLKKVLGVVIPSTNAAIVLTPSNASPSQVLVNNAGELDVLVSDQDGPVVAGDYLAISSSNGIAMKASATQATVVGRADSDFDGKTAVVSVQQIKNSLGKIQTVTIGRVAIQINVTHNPTFKKKTQSDYVPGFIGKIVFQVTSKNVSAARVYIAIVILIGLVIIASTMLFGGLKGGMIAVGRQPLSKKSVMISLIQTTFFAMAIFVGGVIAIYMFLKI